VSRGRQFWESRTEKAFQLTRVSVKRSSGNRGSAVLHFRFLLSAKNDGACLTQLLYLWNTLCKNDL
jgi:hypothetical protein